jgi:branched-subunit amino acid transport protein AzlD
VSSVGITMVALAVGTYALKAAGPLALGSRRLSARVEWITRELPIALLAALVVTMTVTTDGRWVLDARVPGVVAAVVALARRLPFVVVVVSAGVVTALARAIT